MNTIAPGLTQATITAARQFSFYHVAAIGASTQTADAGALIALAVVVLFVAALASAARALAAVLSELLRVAAAVTSVAFSVVIAIVVFIAILMHH